MLSIADLMGLYGTIMIIIFEIVTKTSYYCSTR
jgi:hypothetical protein